MSDSSEIPERPELPQPTAVPPLLPEELPPVQPPSAAFLAQLFLVPGVIVFGIVIVWLLVTRLASGEQDWRALVVELKSADTNRRWRGAFGLAQLLQSDQNRPAAPQPGANPANPPGRLIENPEIAQSLSDLLLTELKRSTAKEADHEFHAFLARTLGLLDAPQIVEPALKAALDSKHDLEIRKNALSAVVMITGRSVQAEKPLPLSPLEPTVIDVSADADPKLRQLAAYALGLSTSEAATDRLKVLLSDADANTRSNAAVGLARQGSTAGLAVLKQLVTEGTREKNTDEYSQSVGQANALKALELLSPKLSQTERDDLIALLDKLINTKGQSAIRVQAQATLNTLRDQK